MIFHSLLFQWNSSSVFYCINHYAAYLNSLSLDITANWIGLIIILKMLSACGVGGFGDFSKLWGTFASNKCLIDPKYSVYKNFHQDYLYLNCMYTYNLSSCIWITIANMISFSFSYLFLWETSRYFPETFFYLYKCQQMWIFLAFSLEDPKILCPMHSGDSFN